MSWTADLRRRLNRQPAEPPQQMAFVRFDFARRARGGYNLARHFSAPVVAALLTLLFLAWVAYRWLWQPAWFRALSPTWVELFDLYEFGSTVTLVVLWGMVLWWQRRQPHQRPRRREVVDVATLYALSPPEFEQFCADVYRRKGYRVSVRGKAGDLGVDLELYQPRSGKRAIVQCKRYRNTIGPDVVRELYGTLLHELVSHAFLVTTADISDAAREWAADKPLTLIDGPTLVAIARELDVLPDPLG